MRCSRITVASVVVSTALTLAVPRAAHADWLATAALGHAATRPSTVVLAQPGQQTQLDIPDVTYRGESFRSPQYYLVRVTWVPDAHPWLGIEGEWIHAKVFANTDETVRMRGTLHGVPVDTQAPLSSVVQRLAMSHGLNFVLANVAVRRDIGPRDAGGARRATLVARLGAGPTLPHAETTIEGMPVDSYQSAGLGAQAGAGIELVLWRRVRAVAEYKFTWAEPTLDVAGGQATIPSRSHHVAFGLGFGL